MFSRSTREFEDEESDEKQLEQDEEYMKVKRSINQDVVKIESEL